MTAREFGWWRPLLILGAALVIIGVPLHPRGTMAEMLAHPDWTLGHLLVLAGFMSVLAGLMAFSRNAALESSLRFWTRFAIVATALQLLEMAVHTAAVVDHSSLIAGRATPILTTHLAIAVVVYPLFAAAMIGFIVAGTRRRAIGSPWIAWLGVIGALGHGAAAPLRIAANLEWASLLFPLLGVLAIWIALAAIWPRRPRAALVAG